MATLTCVLVSFPQEALERPGTATDRCERHPLAVLSRHRRELTARLELEDAIIKGLLARSLPDRAQLRRRLTMDGDHNSASFAHLTNER